MEWKNYWNNLIAEHRLENMIKQLNIADNALGRGSNYTETVCKGVYEDYLQRESFFSSVKTDLLKILDSISNIHSIGNRTKAVDSLLVKIITKRAEKFNTKSPYVSINEEDYANVITDLIGIRLILHYQGQWKDIHEQLLKLFPEDNCKENCLLPHEEGKQFMVEFPIAYHAPEDDTTQFEGIIRHRLHEKGYRSNHYIISFKNVYIELQVRTIYDEAWSDYDHTYVYKKEANPNNNALSIVSPILCKITNAASDIGELMREIYDMHFETDTSGQFIIKEQEKRKLAMIKKHLEEAKNEFDVFCENNVSKQG